MSSNCKSVIRLYNLQFGKNNKPKLYTNQKYNLLIEINRIRQNILYLPSNKTRILVGVVANLANKNNKIIKLI